MVRAYAGAVNVTLDNRPLYSRSYFHALRHYQ